MQGKFSANENDKLTRTQTLHKKHFYALKCFQLQTKQVKRLHYVSKHVKRLHYVTYTFESEHLTATSNLCSIGNVADRRNIDSYVSLTQTMMLY